MGSPTGQATSSTVENQPLSGGSELTGDELALLFGTCCPAAIFVMDLTEDLVVAGNARFAEHVGVALDDPALFASKWEEFVHPDDRSVFNTWRGDDLALAAGSFEVRFRTAGGEFAPACIALRPVRWKQKDYLIAFLRDVSVEREREDDLLAKLEEQKARAVEAINSSLRVYLFNEKIRSTPVLTARLLNVENEQQLFREAAKVMQSEEGLNYRDVTFLTLDSGVLNVAFSTQKLESTSFPLGEENRYSDFLRKTYHVEESDGDILLPLRSRGQLMGVCEVRPYTREKYYFDESGKVGKWQKDMLLTLADLIALLIDNLRLKREIKRRSIMDTLTETYNRYYFVGRLSTEIQRAGRYQRPISMLFVDVDSFKSVNDQYGHLLGDQVLRELGQLFVESLRQTDVICRYGGDEFVALLPETDERMANETAEKLLEAVRSHRFENPDMPDEPLTISVSIGVNTLQPGESEEAFLKGADAALYEAKNSGRNCLAVKRDVVQH